MYNIHLMPKERLASERIEIKLDPEFAAKLQEFRESFENEIPNKPLDYLKILSSIDSIFFGNKGKISCKTESHSETYTLIFGKKKITIEDNPLFRRPGHPSEYCISIFGGKILHPDSGFEIYKNRLRGGTPQLNSMIITGVTRAVTFS